MSPIFDAKSAAETRARVVIGATVTPCEAAVRGPFGNLCMAQAGLSSLGEEVLA